MISDGETSGTSGVRPVMKHQFILGLAAILFMVLLTVLTIYQLNRPATNRTELPPTEFSAQRAAAHALAISSRPHPMGTEAHFEARNYIVSELSASGLTPEVQRTTALTAAGVGSFRAGAVENVIARLKGTSGSKAILLVSHYDSVPTSFGSSDDGAGVAVLLETLRALKAGPGLQNDVIFLFTDGEEIALLGSQAFVSEHPWAKDVAVVLNFEARGVKGPSILFETSDQNGKLIREFAKVAPHPVASSLAYEIYRLLPNNTDLTVFKNAGYPGLNFAYIDGSTHYHTQLDNRDALDLSSIQSHGMYSLALTRHFGNLELQNLRARNAVYFDVLELFLVDYPGAVVPFITLALTIIFLGLVFVGWKKGRLTLVGLAAGLGLHVVILIVVPITIALGWLVLQAVLSVLGRSTQSLAYQGKLFSAGFVVLAIALSYLPYSALLTKIRLANLVASSLAWWLLALFLASLFLTGVTFLLTWPVLFCLPALAYQVFRSDLETHRAPLIFFFLFAVTPGLLILAPAIYLMSIGLNLNSIVVILAVVTLACELLTPHFLSLELGNHRAFVAMFLVVGLTTICVAMFRSGYSAREPKLNNLFYGLNADNGKAIWASLDEKSDEWTSRVLSEKPQKGTVPEFFASGRTGLLLRADAVAAPLPGPNVTLISDDTKDSVRTLRLRINSPRHAPTLSVYLDSVKDLEGLWVNEKRAELQAGTGQKLSAWSVFYYNSPEDGIDLTLQFNSGAPLKMRVLDQSYGLPDLGQNVPGNRPAEIIPAPMVYSDATIVSRSFSY
jgi:hypothetical protein